MWMYQLEDNTCAVDDTGTVTCWGNINVANNTPIGTFTDVEAGSSHACAIAADGTVECWGDSQYYAGTPSTGSFTSLS